jgi:hypothetical protein
VPRCWLRRSRKGLWFCPRDIPPERISRALGFAELAGTSTAALPVAEDPAQQRREAEAIAPGSTTPPNELAAILRPTGYHKEWTAPRRWARRNRNLGPFRFSFAFRLTQTQMGNAAVTLPS